MLSMFLNPILRIIVGLFIVGLMIYFFVKNYNFKIVSQDLRQKILLEDTLKFIFDCQYKGIPCTQNTIAGHLHISTAEILNVINNLLNEVYIFMDGPNILLNKSGEKYALQVIRRHRLWESHLAQNSSVSELEWHKSADEKEHSMSIEETESLAASIGHPVMDPHGDPIPTKEGFLREESGTFLLNLNIGDVGKIIHLEDEPYDIYKEIVNKGFGLGQDLKVMSKSATIMTVLIQGKHIDLPLQFCQNLTIEILDDMPSYDIIYENLTDLKYGEEATIVGLSNQLRGLQRRRLLDFGIVKGSKIYIELKSPFNNPIGYRVLGTTLALRTEQAKQIFIQKNEILN